MRRLGLIVNALRTPLCLLGISVPLVIFRQILIPNLAIILNYYAPSEHVYGISTLRPDYLLYLPNMVTFLAYLLGAFGLLEIKQRILPRNRNLQQDLVTAWIGFGIALSSQLFMANMKPGMLQLLLCWIQVLLLWLFLMCNAGLYVWQRAVTNQRWIIRLLDWTFPISDPLFYIFHRQRLNAAAGRIRYLPSVFYAGLVALGLSLQGRILWGALRAEHVNVPVDDVNSAQLVNGGIWFADSYLWDSRAGIWYYDDQTRNGFPVFRAFDTRLFRVDGDHVYFHDRYDHTVSKVDLKTRQIIWKVPAKLSGTFELVMKDDRVYVVGEGGYILVLDRNGHILAERNFPVLTFEAQAVWGGQVAFVSGDQRVRIWKGDLSAGETIPLPLSKGVVSLAYNPKNFAGYQIVTNMTAYAEKTNIFYAGTFWGEIFRYDVKNRRWLPSLHTHMGLRSMTPDSQNSLLFTANYFQGFLDVLDLESGRHVAYILANGRSRYIDLDPVGRCGVLSTRAYGLYRFTYGDIVQRRNALMLAAQPARMMRAVQ